MPKTKKQTGINIKLTKAAEAAIKKEAEAFGGLTFAKRKKAVQTAYNAAEHSPEVALMVALGRDLAVKYEELVKLLAILNEQLRQSLKKK